jgi:hypothetical protein
MVVFAGILILTLFVSTIWISSTQVNMIHAISDQQQPATIKSISLKITDPIRGQQIGVGKNLTLLGTSKYNATSNCQVFVIVDSVRPYQKTIPIGQAGGDDYSKWRYAIAPSYAGSIKEGINRITAKLLCNTNPTTLTKFYSINVTGVNETLPKQQHLAIRSNYTAAPFFLPVSSSFASAPLNNTNAPPIIPVSVNSSALITPLSAPSSSNPSASSDSSSSSGDHHTNHRTSSSSDTHTTTSDHHSGNNGSSDNNHHHHHNGVDGGGNNLIHGIISHIGGF